MNKTVLLCVHSDDDAERMPDLFSDFFDETTTRVRSVVREKNIYYYILYVIHNNNGYICVCFIYIFIKYDFVVFVESKERRERNGGGQRGARSIVYMNTVHVYHSKGGLG